MNQRSPLLLAGSREKFPSGGLVGKASDCGRILCIRGHLARGHFVWSGIEKRDELAPPLIQQKLRRHPTMTINRQLFARRAARSSVADEDKLRAVCAIGHRQPAVIEAELRIAPREGDAAEFDICAMREAGNSAAEPSFPLR
jgi:hypothetical protein